MKIQKILCLLALIGTASIIAMDGKKDEQGAPVEQQQAGTSRRGSSLLMDTQHWCGTCADHEAQQEALRQQAEKQHQESKKDKDPKNGQQS